MVEAAAVVSRGQVALLEAVVALLRPVFSEGQGVAAVVLAAAAVSVTTTQQVCGAAVAEKPLQPQALEVTRPMAEVGVVPPRQEPVEQAPSVAAAATVRRQTSCRNPVLRLPVVGLDRSGQQLLALAPAANAASRSSDDGGEHASGADRGWCRGQRGRG